MGGLEVTLRSRFPFENSDSEGKFAGVGNYLKKRTAGENYEKQGKGKRSNRKEEKY